jgi:hypothetical protein
MKRPRELGVKVESAPKEIDLAKWANNYCRRVLELEGVSLEAQRREIEPLQEAS